MKILVTDDHASIRDALRGVLKQLRSDASVFEASDSRQAMRIIDDHPNCLPRSNSKVRMSQRVKSRKAHSEQMLSALPPIATK